MRRALGLTVVCLTALVCLDLLSSAGTGSSRPPAGAAAPAVIYDQAIDAAHRDGLRVWLEADLVKRWLAGPVSFQQAIGVLAEQSQHPGVVGIKIADELGYHDGLGSTANVDAFLDASAAALHHVAAGKAILVDLLVPELGCLPGYPPTAGPSATCQAQAKATYPWLSLTATDGYLARHDLDVVDLSTDLRTAATYASWGIDLPTAQQAAWQAAMSRGWTGVVRLQARKALAHPGEADSTTAADALRVFVDIPLALGAQAVDVWTWRQLYHGQLYRLTDPGLRANALWAGLVARHQAGDALFTHFSPRSVEIGLDADLQMLALAFTDLFVASGTG